MKRILICFEVNKIYFIRLFCIKAKRNLHAKRIKTEANILFLANILFISLQSKYFEAKMKRKFSKKKRILVEALDLWNAFLYNLKQHVSNICYYANICKQIFVFMWIFCKQIFAWMWYSLEVFRIFTSKQIFWSKYSPEWENEKRIFALKQILASTCIVMHQIEYLYVNLCEYFANVKWLMPINGIYEYTVTC